MILFEWQRQIGCLNLNLDPSNSLPAQNIRSHFVKICGKFSHISSNLINFLFFSQLEISKRNLKLLHNELETLVPSKDIETTNSPSDLHLSEEENGSNFEDVVSIASEES